MTECSETLFPFEAHFSRRVVAQFAGDWLTTEGGSLLLRQADRKIGLLRRVAGCFSDYRQPERIEHRLEEMLAMWTTYSGLRGTSACGRSSAARCRKPNRSTGARENRRGCSVSSLIAPRKAGRG